ADGKAEVVDAATKDMNLALRILELQVAGHVAEHREGAQLCFERGGAVVQGLDVLTLQRELVKGLGRSPADADGRWDLEVGPDAGNGGELGVQLADDLVDGEALAEWLEVDAEPSLIHRPTTHR